MAHVFISYSHEDFEFAENLWHRLEKAGFEVWMDEERLHAGEDWREEIDTALRNSFVLVLVLSPASQHSRYVMYEWSFALGAGKSVIPILLKTVEKELHPRLDKKLYLNFTDRKRDWDKLIYQLEEKKLDTSDATSRVINEEIPLFVKRAIEELESRVPSDNVMAIQDLEESDHPIARQTLFDAVQHHRKSIRTMAAFAVANFPAPDNARAIPGLIEALKDTDYNIRKSAIEALGEIGDISTAKEIVKLLKDNSWAVIVVAAKTLGLLKYVDAVPDLIEILRNKYREPDKNIKEIAQIIKMGSVFDSVDNMARNQVCQAVLEALKNISTPEALAAVEEWEAN